MIALALALVAAMPQPAPLPIAQEDAVPVEEWQLDQVRIASDTDDKVLKALEPVHTLDDAIAVLKKLNVPFQRTPAVILPDRMPPDLKAKILALPKGEPFVLPEGGFISISVLVARKLPPDAVRFRPQPTHFLPPQEA